jgi:hypothetical protein
MKTHKLIFGLLLGSFLFACSDSDDDPQPIEGDATYKVTVTGMWSAASHPTDYPSNSHFSPVIGMTHKAGTNFFQEGQLASDGMENMAETGGTNPLDDEIENLVATGGANQLIKEGGLGTGTSSRTFEINVARDFPLVTLVSMIAPSPDWFVAVENVNLLDNGQFVDMITVNTKAYDSGTDSGTTFTSGNADTSPAENIFEITSAPLGDGTSVTPTLVSIKFEKITTGM